MEIVTEFNSKLQASTNAKDVLFASIEQYGEVPLFSYRNVLNMHREVSKDLAGDASLKEYPELGPFEDVTNKQFKDTVINFYNGMSRFIDFDPTDQIMAVTLNNPEGMYVYGFSLLYGVPSMALPSTEKDSIKQQSGDFENIKVLVITSLLFKDLYQILPNLPKVKLIVYVDNGYDSATKLTDDEITQMNDAFYGIAFIKWTDIIDFGKEKETVYQPFKVIQPSDWIFYSNSTVGTGQIERVAHTDSELLDRAKNLYDDVIEGRLPLYDYMTATSFGSMTTSNYFTFAMLTGKKIMLAKPTTLFDSDVRYSVGDFNEGKPAGYFEYASVLEKIYKDFLLNIENGVYGEAFLNSYKLLQKLNQDFMNGKFSNKNTIDDLNKVIFKPMRELFGGNLQALNVSSEYVPYYLLEFYTFCVCPDTFMTFVLSENATRQYYLRLADKFLVQFQNTEVELRDDENLGLDVSRLENGRKLGILYFNKDGWTSTGYIMEEVSPNKFKYWDKAINSKRLENGALYMPSYPESLYRKSLLIERVILYIQNEMTQPVALVTLEESELRKRLNDDFDQVPLQLVAMDHRVIAAVMEELSNVAGENEIEDMYLPVKIALIPQSFYEKKEIYDTNSKVLRERIYDNFRTELDQLVEESKN